MEKNNRQRFEHDLPRPMNPGANWKLECYTAPNQLDWQAYYDWTDYTKLVYSAGMHEQQTKSR